MGKFSLTKELLAHNPAAFQQATQSDFLKQGAQGKLSKGTLGEWLGNDRLYIHGYIHGIGSLLSRLQLPQTVGPDSKRNDAVEVRLLDWMVDALVNIRREEKFFVDTAANFNIDINLKTDPTGVVANESKLEGLRRFEELFGSIGADDRGAIPWLRDAVIFWGTEKCYLEAWSWAKSQLDEPAGGDSDADGGALRNEFIPNWTSAEFVKFVDDLGAIIDDAVEEHAEIHGAGRREKLLELALPAWQSLLEAEKLFWPSV
jgi:thiaminase